MKIVMRKFPTVKDDPELKITIILKEQENLIANAHVSIPTSVFGWISIKGFQIWHSSRLNERLQEKINITPPSRQIYGRYSQIVFFENKELWFKLESRIYEAYLKAIITSSEKSGLKENINPEDIPL